MVQIFHNIFRHIDVPVHFVLLPEQAEVRHQLLDFQQCFWHIQVAFS